MRKAHKHQAEELVRQMQEAHDQIKKFIGQGSIPQAMELLEECQNGGIALGTLIERTEGEGHPTVSLLEGYCERIYQIHEDLAADKAVNANKVHKLLRQKLMRISNSLKNDIPVRKEVVFLPYKASMWDSLESVYLAAKEDPDCDAYCVPIPYYDLDQDRDLGQMHYEGDEYPKDIEVTDWRSYDLEERRPDVIYIHNPYDDCNLVTSVHPRYYSSNLKKYTDILVYIPYYMTTGKMSKGQRLCPAYINADYIVIQSPQLRDHFDERIPDKKFLPFGSPKADRVIRKCQYPPVPPLEWQEKMAGKRVYFYNTSISGMLADTECFLKKMQYVFRCFEEHKDACVLWRPHPLLEATFHSMRPEYVHAFEKIKRAFTEQQIGILDTNADIEDSIALSDAYIGDAGTSVTALFGVAGKPIFVLNNKIHEKPAKDSWRKKICMRFDFQEQDQFIIIQGDQLYVSAPGQYDYRYLCALSANRCRKYASVLQINGKRYAYPSSAQDILVLGDHGVERTIELEPVRSASNAFAYGWKYDRFLILLPLDYPALVRFDTTTEECLYVREHIDVYINEKDGHKVIGGSFISKGSLYLASPTDNKICRFDIDSGKMQVFEIPIQSMCGCIDLAVHEGVFWMLPYKGRTIVRWDPQTDEAIGYTGFPDGFACTAPDDSRSCGELPFSSMAFCGDYIYLAPQYANMFLRFHIPTGRFVQWRTPFEEGSEGNRILAGIKDRYAVFLKWESEDDRFKIYSSGERRLYSVDLKTDAWEEIEISFDMKEIEAHSISFQERLKTLRYACSEGDLCSLGRFLDDATMGNTFERDKQLLAYGEIIADIEGNCGRNIYEYIKGQG